MDKDIKDAISELTLKRLEIQAIRDNTAVLVDIAANLEGICDFLEEINDHIKDIDDSIYEGKRIG